MHTTTDDLYQKLNYVNKYRGSSLFPGPSSRACVLFFNIQYMEVEGQQKKSNNKKKNKLIMTWMWGECLTSG